MDNPFVNGVLDQVRLYAAAPLILSRWRGGRHRVRVRNQRQELTRVQLERLRDIADQAVLILQLSDDAARLGQAATRDHLTGLPNRALFAEALAMALAKHQRGRRAEVIFSTSTGSSRSTTPTATRSATSCCGRWRTGWWTPSGRPTWSPGCPATSW